MAIFFLIMTIQVNSALTCEIFFFTCLFLYYRFKHLICQEENLQHIYTHAAYMLLSHHLSTLRISLFWYKYQMFLIAYCSRDHELLILQWCTIYISILEYLWYWYTCVNWYFDCIITKIWRCGFHWFPRLLKLVIMNHTSGSW